MGDNCVNWRVLFGFCGFLIIIVIGFVIILMFFVDEIELVREIKGLKSVKFNKVRRIFYIFVNLFLKLLFLLIDKLFGCFYLYIF